jgi:branched-chain amino acid transport system permease protein
VAQGDERRGAAMRGDGRRAHRRGRGAPHGAAARAAPPPGSAPAPRASRRATSSLAARAALPVVASPFFTYQIGAQSLALGLIALSLTFLGGYGGMVSLAQMTVAGVAGYLVAILRAAAARRHQPRLAWWFAVPFALALACVSRPRWAGSRCEPRHLHDHDHAGDRRAFFYLAQQNYTLFNGFQASTRSPHHRRGIDFREPVRSTTCAGLRAGGLLLHQATWSGAPFGVR